MTKYNPLYDPATDNQPIDPRVQKEIINDPKNDVHGMTAEDKAFLNQIVKLFSENRINPYSPSSLINKSVYDSLPSDKKATVEIEAHNLIGKLRLLRELYSAGYRETFQINNLVHSIRNLKERIEVIRGDVFIV